MTEPLPPAPEGLRIEFLDGTTRPLTAVYVGKAGDTAQWEVVDEIDLYALSRGRATIRADLIPGRTEVRLSGRVS